MKVAIVIADGVRQIMFSAESDMEKQALEMLSKKDQSISVDFHTGTMYDRVPPSAAGYTVQSCQGGYLRAFEQSNALMLVLRDK